MSDDLNMTPQTLTLDAVPPGRPDPPLAPSRPPRRQSGRKSGTPTPSRWTSPCSPRRSGRWWTTLLQKIDVTDSNVVLQYGAAAQKNIASFSENALNSVKTKDLGEVGEALSDLVVELKKLRPG